MFGDDSSVFSVLEKTRILWSKASQFLGPFRCVSDSMHFLIISLGATEGNKGSIQINFICPGMNKIVLTQLIITVSFLLGYSVSYSSWDFGSLPPHHFCDFLDHMLLLYPLVQRIYFNALKKNTQKCIWCNTLYFIFIHGWIHFKMSLQFEEWRCNLQPYQCLSSTCRRRFSIVLPFYSECFWGLQSFLLVPPPQWDLS